LFNEPKGKPTSGAHDWQVRYDNACMESFFARLKQELVYHRQYQTGKEARQDIFEYFEYIQVWYIENEGTQS
jgi:hypothetical protein